MRPKVAAVTMAYNEPVFLPIWARHYARQVGADACYVIDHGSTELPILPAGINIVRLPRSPQDDPRRAGFVSAFTTSLLSYYDWVLHSDVDELVLADPYTTTDLLAFCAAADADTISAVGLDVQHVPALEPPYDSSASIGAQRGWARFTSAMCKPVLTRVAVNWTPGFHHADRPVVFASLFLFHLHWFDRGIGLERLNRTRSMQWQSDQFGAHQRVSDHAWSVVFDGMASLPRLDPIPFAPADPPIYHWLARVLESGRAEELPHRFDLHVNAPELWPIPPHFRQRL